jgi:chaperonin cofactor prefoldin
MRKIAFFILVVIAIVIIVLLLSIKPVNYNLPGVVVRKVTVEREQRSQSGVQSREGKMSEIPQDSRKYVEGEVLVKFKQNVRQQEIEEFLSQYNLEVKKVISGINVYNLQLPEGVKVKDIIEKLKQDSRIEYAEPNYLFKLY